MLHFCLDFLQRASGGGSRDGRSLGDGSDVADS